VPPAGTNMTDPSEPWLGASCAALEQIASEVSLAEYPFGARNFTGLMLVNGYCTAEAIKRPQLAPIEAKVVDELSAFFDSPLGTATKVSISLALDPFSPDGQQWIKQMRTAMGKSTSIGGVAVGQMYLTGYGPQQMDAANATFGAFGLMVGLVLVVLCLVFGVAFKSVVVPLRATLTVVWMLVLVFGACVYAYQNTAAGQATFWMAPCVAFPIVVGLGLDYDVFFIESCAEHVEAGVDVDRAVVAALKDTGNIISAAGVIMMLAFAPLLLGTTPALYQIGFLLTLGVVVDCFLTTKLIIPCLMGLVPGRYNFWPRKVETKGEGGPTAHEASQLLSVAPP